MEQIYETLKKVLSEAKHLPFSDSDTESDLLNPEVFQYKTHYDHEDGVTTIRAFDKQGYKIGYIVYTPLYEPMEYELEGFIGDEEFDELYPDGDNIIKIDYLVVNPQYRGKGIASKLMNMVLDSTSKDGHTEYYLNASPMDDYTDLNELIKFYNKFGFKTFKHQGVNALMAKV